METRPLLERRASGSINYKLILSLSLGVYLFLFSLGLFKESWAFMFNKEGPIGAFLYQVIQMALSTPVSSLLSGILLTSLVQSSSATIALIVALVGANTFTAQDSVFMIMGANIGTTVTNTIVGIAHGTKAKNFSKVVSAVVIDDLFKVFNVIIFAFIEYFTGILASTSTLLIDTLAKIGSAQAGLTLFPDFIEMMTGPLIELFFSTAEIAFPMVWQGPVLGLLAFSFIILSLRLMSLELEKIFKNKSQDWLSSFFGSKIKSFLIGFGICWFVQSSSVTTSLILPLVALDGLKLLQVYFYCLGAALATTCDPGQLLSYLKFGPIGLQVGLVHIFLNLFGIMLFAFVGPLRRLPLHTAKVIGEFVENKTGAPLYLLAYTICLFYILPLMIIWIF